ncbi:type I secretion system permease/ATPase [Brevundimonas sp. NIBR11]|uniref:type I secretion system permease/ATPase n=1 Tax=Brevundimonas sp. NIBR11 TaxID=3015999 RepID=UPI0022F117D0|nr:type I secretion system permease/ATPase [Brevundimonas sp. NIBR11]WGM29912.1 Type I secretion system ATP-binding protein PrsD [Brevundimonas sp. NIBR11]
MLDALLGKRPGSEPLFAALRQCRVHFVGAALFSALVNLLYLTPTLYMMQVYDRVVPTAGLTTLVLVSAVAIFALGSLAALDWLRTRILVRAGIQLDRDLAGTILARVTEAGGRSQGVQALRDFDALRGAISGQGTLALFDAPWTPIYLACCFLLHPAIGVLTFVGGAILAVLAWLNERDTRPRLGRASKAGNAAYAAQEALTGQSEVVQALGMRRAIIARQVQGRNAATDAQAEAQLTGGRYSGAIKFVRLALQSAALGLAAFLVVKGEMSPGSIIASSVLLSRAVMPIEQLVGAWPALVQARTAWKGLIDLFTKTAGHGQPRTALPAPRGRVSAETIGVRLPNTQTPQLRGVSVTLEPGQVLGVIGASGSGKTTLARVMAGALSPDTGSMRLDGADYGARDSDALARHIGYLPQSPTLFAGTIKENISRFADPSLEVDAAAVRAAQAAGVHDLIQRLPGGYDTPLGPQGAGLSAGQSQRIGLARALYGDPVLLVLDEPNASLDQDGETALIAAVEGAAARGAAVVIIAHRAGVLAKADRLLALRDGMVQVEGPREEVLARLRGPRPAGLHEVKAG